MATRTEEINEFIVRLQAAYDVPRHLTADQLKGRLTEIMRFLEGRNNDKAVRRLCKDFTTVYAKHQFPNCGDVVAVYREVEKTIDGEGNLRSMYVVIKPHSEAWRAWRDYNIRHRIPVRYMDRCGVEGIPYGRPSEFPPADAPVAVKDEAAS